MKKQLLFLIVLIALSAGMAFGQVLYSDDFESYTVGNGIADEETGDIWNTWSAAPGGDEDPLVSDAFAHSGTQSIVVEGLNDGVIEFNDITTNRYRVEFYLYIPSGKQGYYNIMQNFDPTGNDNVWGMQITFQNGVGSIDGNGAAEQTFAYLSDTWIKMQHFIDLDNDWVDMYIDGELVHAYQWSHGTFNDGTGINKLDAFDFYAWNVGGTCQYYMDDFLIEQVAIPNPPINFAVEVQNENDVYVTWEAPAEGTPVSYSVIREGEEIAVVEGEFSYTDQGLYPGEYTYQVKAYYGEGVGYSASAGVETAQILGGNERQLVLFEIFTGTWCQYCPTAAQAIDIMADENLDVAIIEYHGLNGDTYETPSTATRTAYYLPFFDDGDGGLGYPTTIINGMNGMEGSLTAGVAAQNEYYDYYYEDYLSRPTVYTVDAEISLVSNDPYVFDVSVDVEETMAYYEGDEMRLFVALTETSIPENWQGGLTEVNFVLRNMLPNANGTLLNFDTETMDTETFQLTVDNAYELANCEVVIFVQNMENAFIMEAYKMSLAEFVGMETIDNNQFSVYPNPAKDNVRIASGSVIKNVQVYSITGEQIMFVQPNSNLADISIDGLASGVYILRIETADGNEMKRIIVE